MLVIFSHPCLFGPKGQKGRCNAFLCLHKKALQGLGFVRVKFVHGTSKSVRVCLSVALPVQTMATGQPKLIISSNVSARHVQHGYAFRCKVIFIKTCAHYCFKLLFYLCARRARIRLALNYVGQVLMNELYLIVRVLCLIVNIINCCKCAYCWKIKFLVLVESISALLYPVVYKMQKFFQFQRFFVPGYSFCVLA